MNTEQMRKEFEAFDKSRYGYMDTPPNYNTVDVPIGGIRYMDINVQHRFEYWQAAINSQAKSVPDVVVVNNMNFDGDSHYGTREGDVFVLDDGDVYTYEQLKSEYECEWYYAAPPTSR